MKGKALIWMCNKCKWITVSDQSPHRMDRCKCGETAVDHEVHYTRVSAKDFSNCIMIARVDLDKGTFVSLKRRNRG